MGGGGQRVNPGNCAFRAIDDGEVSERAAEGGCGGAAQLEMRGRSRHQQEECWMDHLCGH